MRKRFIALALAGLTLAAFAEPTETHGEKHGEVKKHDAAPQTPPAYTFHGNLIGCSPVPGSETEYKNSVGKVHLQPNHVVTILMVVDPQSHWWRPARADDPDKRCVWAFVNQKRELAGRLKTPSRSGDGATIVFGSMCGRKDGRYLYVPWLKDPWVFIPSCEVQGKDNLFPTITVQQNAPKSGEDSLSQVFSLDPKLIKAVSNAGRASATVAAGLGHPLVSSLFMGGVKLWDQMTHRDPTTAHDRPTGVEPPPVDKLSGMNE